MTSTSTITIKNKSRAQDTSFGLQVSRCRGQEASPKIQETRSNQEINPEILRPTPYTFHLIPYSVILNIL